VLNDFKNREIMKLIYIIVLAFCINNICIAQDSLIAEFAKNNVSTFSKNENSFTGSGWEKIIEQAKKSDNVLIGEMHFTNEIPAFFSALTAEIKFDNFFVEIDPYSAKILETKIKTLSAGELKKYRSNYGNTFSFYALEPEFNLLQQSIKSNTKIFGTDQISSVADRLICSELQKTTKSPEAKKIYKIIEDSSKVYFDKFLKSKGSPEGFPFYFFTNEFQKNLTDLSALKLSREEISVIESMRLSAKIYQEQSHHLRIQLMKNELMKVYPEWDDKKNLFKYGANHLAKGESLLKIYDIGNVVNNIADSKFKNSLHIMIVGKSGSQGSPFKDFPEQKITENDNYVKPLIPLLKTVNGEDWHCFNMAPLREALEQNKIVVNDVELSRIIEGYDFVIVIPTVTASKFPTVE